MNFQDIESEWVVALLTLKLISSLLNVQVNLTIYSYPITFKSICRLERSTLVTRTFTRFPIWNTRCRL